MATIDTIALELKDITTATKLARSVYSLAYKAKADNETQQFLWNKYYSLLSKKGMLEIILQQLGVATIDLQKAAEWSSIGVYAPHILDILKLTYPSCSDAILKLHHQALIDKAAHQHTLAMEEVAWLVEKAKPYLSI